MRADLVKQILRSYQARDDEMFRAAASKIIEEEKRKHHTLLAHELQEILDYHPFEKRDGRALSLLPPPPQDNDRQASLFHVRTPDRYLHDLVVSTRVESAIARVMQELTEWDILASHGLQPVRRVIFFGPPGCGKTVTAEAIATEMGLPLIHVRFDAVVSSLLGETASNLRKIFDYAERGEWVIFFDEFDAIGRSRADPTEHGEIKRVVNSFLQILDSFHGRSLIIAATNFHSSLDFALWRRFDEIICFGKPSESEILELLRRQLRSCRITKRQEMQLASTLLGASHAEVERLCLDIRKSSVLRGSQVASKEDIRYAITRYEERSELLSKSFDVDSR